MLKKWKKLSSKIEFKNPWWEYRIDQFEIPGIHKGEYHYTHTNGSSMVVPIMKNGKIIMVKQFRYLSQRESIEFPAGSVKDGHNYKQTAAEELAEETGYAAKNFKKCGVFNPYNGVTDEICTVFLATDLYEFKKKADKTEEFEILNINQLEKLIKSNKIWDGMTLASWMLAKPFIVE